MSAELKATLILNGKPYEMSLQSAVKETKKFQKQTEDTKKELDDLSRSGGKSQEIFQQIGKAVGMSDTQLLKYGKSLATVTELLGIAGGAITTAVGIFKTYDAIMQSNKITAAQWNDSLGSLTVTVDNFFNALATGDWSIFNKGIMHAIELGYKYKQALRDITNDLKIGDAQMSEHEKELHKYENISINPLNTTKEREDAYQKFLEEVKASREHIEGLSKGVEANWDKVLAGKNITLSGEQKKKSFDFLSSYTKEGQALTKYQSLLSQIQSQENYLNQNSTDAEERKRSRKKLNELYAERRELLKMYAELPEMLKLKGAFGDGEELDQFVDMSTRLSGYQDRLESIDTSMQGLAKDFDENGKLINKEIKLPKFTLENMLPESAKEAGIKLPVIPILKGKETLPQLEKQLADLRKELENSQTSGEYAKIKAKIVIKENEIDQFKKGNTHNMVVDYIANQRGPVLEGNDEMFKRTREMLDLSDQVEGKVEGNNNKIEKSYEKVEDALGSVGNMFGSLGSAVGGTGGEILNFFGATAQGIADIIPQIQTLIAAKEAEAIASGTASGASVMFPGNIAAIASIIATIAGVFASLPTFASGGIIGGTTSMGDYGLARVNAGEMLLNNRQQRQLFRLFNGFGNFNNNITPTVNFKITGKELVGVLNNYKNRREKVL